MIRSERFQLRLAAIAASATIVAGVGPSCIELIDNAGQSSHSPISCAAAVERVVEIEEEHPPLAELYADEAEYLPDLLSEEEEEACGDATQLAEEIGRELADQSTAGRDTSRR